MARSHICFGKIPNPTKYGYKVKPADQRKAEPVKSAPYKMTAAERRKVDRIIENFNAERRKMYGNRSDLACMEIR